MAPRGYVTPSSNRSRSRTPYAPQSQRSRRRTPRRMYASVSRAVLRPVVNDYIHEFKHTLPFSVPLTYSSGGANTRGFILPGTPAGTANWGLRWSCTPSGVTVLNNNNGILSKVYNNLPAYTAIFQNVRIKNVTIHVYFSQNMAFNTNGTNIAASPFMPILISSVCSDLFEPVPSSEDAILDYPNAISRQCGTMSGRGGSMLDLSFTPRTASSLTGSNAQNLLPASTWLSVDNGGMLQDHACCIMALDDFGIGEIMVNNTYGGNFSFQVSMTVQYKGLK